jgi:phospholipase C
MLRQQGRWAHLRRNLLKSADKSARRVANLRIEALEDRCVPTGNVLSNIHHFVIIYQENWSFDGLYGLFPGADGLNNVKGKDAQFDKFTGQQITTLPQPLNHNAPDPRFPANLPAHPYNISQYITPSDATGDLVHRFYQEQSQINGGLMNGFVSWSDNGGLTLSFFDASNLPEGQLAQQYVLADHTFHAAYGGSFLNHQFLIAAQAPVYPNAPSGFMPTLDANGHLALDSSGHIIHDGNITPDDHAVNTIFSANLVPPFVHDATQLLPSQNDSNPNAPNYIPTFGDRLSANGISWKWYSGGWNDALAGNANSLFQWHHQPYAYFDNYAPGTPGRAAHLQDETNFFMDASAGTLPAVSYIKPLGPDNEHPGYASLLQGQQHVMQIVNALQSSPQWADTAVIITYDENGGRWDHVAPPVRDSWGDGTRVPLLVVSPFAKRGFVDHTFYDTLSILRTIEFAFGVKPLNQRDGRAQSLINAFTFSTVSAADLINPLPRGLDSSIVTAAQSNSATTAISPSHEASPAAAAKHVASAGLDGGLSSLLARSALTGSPSTVDQLFATL